MRAVRVAVVLTSLAAATVERILTIRVYGNLPGCLCAATVDRILTIRLRRGLARCLSVAGVVRRGTPDGLAAIILGS